MKVFAMPYFCQNERVYVAMKLFAAIGVVYTAVAIVFVVTCYLATRGDSKR